MELNCIRLLVKDFDKCFEFYSKILGLPTTWGKPGGEYASFDMGMPSGLSIFKTDLMAAAVGNSDKPLPENHREKMLIVLKVEDVDASYKDLVAKGVSFVNEPADKTGWGMRAAHFRDPEGNLLEIWSELSREKWDKDLLDDAREFET